MDDRTAQILDALNPLGVQLLVELLARPATEAELRSTLDEPSQSTANRRLERMSRARIVAQEPGKSRAPGRLWTVVHPSETDVLLAALFDLSAAIESRDRRRRDEASRKLKQARAERLGLRGLRSSSA